MDFTTVCRMCLKTISLNPIFGDSGEWCRHSKAVHITTGIKVTPDDGLPQKICSFCVNFINQSLKFRKKCIDVESKLLKAKQNLDIKNSEQTNDESVTQDINVIDIREPTDTELKLIPENYELVLKLELIESEYTDIEVLEEEVDDEPSEYHIETIDTTDSDDNTTEKNLPYIPNKTSNAKNKRVTCKLCQKDLSIRSIDGHMARSHPGADERKEKCELCDSYLIKQKMTRHMKQIHGIQNGMEKKFGRCGYCKTEFDTKEELLQHVPNCTAKKKKRKAWELGRKVVECDLCIQKMQKASLRLHKEMVHGGLKPICEHCGKAFGNKYRLNEHYRAKHGYDKFKCSYCDFESAGITALKNHERRHRCEKPFACDLCGAKFHALYLLSQHRKSHRVDRPLKCDVCSATFKTTNSVHMHKKACHGLPLYKCSECPRSFSCRQYVRKHMRRAHSFKGPIPTVMAETESLKNYDVDEDNL